MLTSIMLATGCLLASREISSAVFPLTSASAIHQLPLDEARGSRPVDLTATVTYSDRSGTLFVADQSGGVYVIQPKRARYPQGTIVKIKGFTGPGDFAPVIKASEIIDTGRRAELKARPASFDDLAGGAEDCELVEVRGIVRTAGVNPATHFAEIQVAGPGGRLRVQIGDTAGITNFGSLLDAKVAVHGAVGGIFNQKRQLVAAKLFVASITNIVIEEKSPAEPFDIPLREVKSLLQYPYASSHGHRVKVRGVVTFAQSPTTIFLRDSGEGIEIQLQDKAAMEVGDEVEVVGFPAAGEWTPLLEDASARKIGKTEPPAANAVTAEEALQGGFDSELVQLEGTLVEYVPRNEGKVLVLQSRDILFNAWLLGPPDESFFAELEKGSRLSVSGICQVQVVGPDKARQSFRLLLRSARDVRVLAGPPWWTLRRFLWVLAVVTGVLLLVCAWVVVLGRKLQAQAVLIRQTVQQEAVHRERARIAQDIHDDVGSSLTRITMLAERAQEALPVENGAGQHVRNIVSSARSTVQSLDEIVWAVNPDNDSLDSLVGYINQFATQFFESSATRCRLETPTGLPQATLPSEVRHNLFLIVKEALTNVSKHSGAREVHVKISVTKSQMRISIEDTGAGFHVNGHLSGRKGNGLSNMNKRMASMGGRLHIGTAPGQGTRLELEMPLTFQSP